MQLLSSGCRHLLDRYLALTRIGYTVDPVLVLASDPAAWGKDVVTCGYPLPVSTRNPDTCWMRSGGPAPA